MSSELTEASSSPSPPTNATSADDVTMQDTTSISDHDHDDIRRQRSLQASSTTTSTSQKLRPVPYILIENLSRSINYGTLLRCCVAYGMKQIIVVGYDKCSTHGSHGSSKHIQLIAFPTHDEAIHYIKHTLQCNYIIGLLGGRGNTYDDNGNTVKEIHVTKPNDDNENNNDDNDVVAKKNLYYKKFHETVQIDVASAGDVPQTTTKQSSNHSSLPKSYPIHINPFNIQQITATTPTTTTSITRSKTKTANDANDDVNINTTQSNNNNNNNVCFVVGKKTRGLPISLAKLCDWYVHIPHVAVGTSTNASDTTADNDDEDDEFVLLNMESCLSIVLHHFMAYAGYEDGSNTTAFTGQKYNVARINKGELAPTGAGNTTATTTTTSATRDQRTQQRLDKKAKLQQEANDVVSMANVAVDMFGNNNNNNDDDQGDY